MKNKYYGSCLCGKVRFEIEGEFDQFYLCHCEHCRKDTGSAHSANLFSSSACLKWIVGEDKVKTFNLFPTQHVKSFCTDCGSALPNLHMEGKLLVVPAGSLNGELAMTPNAHIFVSSKADWDSDLENLPQLERLPG
ncbi:GFA family protein [Gynuella sp.]|uniref:GFA family protein n=1 Tax=Gynuella sp. TaxID=2969146 RepID=UPI003D13052C